MAPRGRWFMMDSADIDNDSNGNIVAGAIDYSYNVPAALAAQMETRQIPYSRAAQYAAHPKS